MGKLSQYNFTARNLKFDLHFLFYFSFLKQNATTFHVRVQDDNSIAVSLEASDVMSPSSVYVVKITGESKNYFFEFEEFNSTLPPPIIFKASYHGLYYIITLVVVNGNVVTKPSRSITVLTSKRHVRCCALCFFVVYIPMGLTEGGSAQNG